MGSTRNLFMDLEDAGNLAQVRFLIHDRDAKYLALIEEILSSAKITTVLTGVRIPRMNSITERWVKTLRAELLDRTLIWNETHPRHALHEYERHYNLHRTHRALAAAAPIRELPHPLEADRIERLAALARGAWPGLDAFPVPGRSSHRLHLYFTLSAAALGVLGGTGDRRSEERGDDRNLTAGSPGCDRGAWCRVAYA
jgi:Integrase core domain